MGQGTSHAHTAHGAGVVYFADLNAANSGNNTAIAAVAGFRIVLIAGDVITAGAVTVTFQSSGGTVLDGPQAYAANGGKLYPEIERGHFATPVGEGLVVNLTGAVQVGGHLVYALVPVPG